MTGINEKSGGMVLIMPINELIHTGGFERTNEKEMMDRIIGKLYDEMNRREGTPPYYIFVDVEFEIISKNKDGEKYIERIKPDAIIVGEKSLIIVELKHLYGNVRIECSKNEGTANGKQAGEVKCNEFSWKNADTGKEIMYENGRAVDPIKQIKRYRGKLWNLIKEYFGEEKVDDRSIGRFIATYIVLPDSVQVYKDDNVYEWMENNSTWFKLLKLKDVAKEILMQEVPHNNKVRKSMRDDLDEFVKFLISHVSPQQRGYLVHLKGEEILGWYWPYKAKKERKINESFPRIREILERKKAPEIYDALRAIDLLGLYELYNDLYDAIIEDSSLDLKYKEYALYLKRASMDMSNKEREFAHYLLRILDQIRNSKFFMRVIEELSKCIDKEWIESAVVLKKISMLMIKYATSSERDMFIIAAGFLSSFDEMPVEAINNVLKVYRDLSGLLWEYVKLCINKESVSEQNIDKFCNICVSIPPLVSVFELKSYALLSIATSAPDTVLDLLDRDADEFSILYESAGTKPFNPLYTNTYTNTLYLLTKILDIISSKISGSERYEDLLRVVDRHLKGMMEIIIKEREEEKNNLKHVNFRILKNIRQAVDILSKIPSNEAVDSLYNIWKWVKSNDRYAQFRYEVLEYVFEKIVNYSGSKAREYVVQILEDLDDDDFYIYIDDVVPRYAGDKEIADAIYERIKNNEGKILLWTKLANMGVPDYLDVILSAIKNFISSNKHPTSPLLEGLLSYNDPDVILKALNVVRESVQDNSSDYYPDLPGDLSINEDTKFWDFVSEHADERWFDVLFHLTIMSAKNYFTNKQKTIENMIDILMKIDGVKFKNELLEYLFKCQEDLSLSGLLHFVANYDEKLGITSEDFYRILHRFMREPEFLSKNNEVTRRLAFIVDKKIDLETISGHKEEIMNLIDNCVKYSSNNLVYLISMLLKKIYAVSGDSFVSQLEKYKSFNEDLFFLVPLLEHPTEKGLDALLNYLIDNADTSYVVYNLGDFAGVCLREELLFGFRKFKCGEQKEMFDYAVDLLHKFLSKKDEYLLLDFREKHAINFLVYFWGECGVNAIVDLLDVEKHSDINLWNVEMLLRCLIKNLRRVKLDEQYGHIIKNRIAKLILKGIGSKQSENLNVCSQWESINKIIENPDEEILC